jgi:DNA-binding NarL/FixJ family response regulator
MARDIRILVLGKANLMRDGLCALLGAQDGFDVCAVLEADAGRIETAAVTPSPDVALVYLALLTGGGLSAIIATRRRWPNVRVLALTSRLDERIFVATTEAGVDGYLLESDSHTELLGAIRTVSKGGRYLASSIFVHGIGQPDKLTDRETQVMKLIAAGYRTREIAHQLLLSHKTIEKHRASLMRKLGVRTAVAVAAYATAQGHRTL